MVTAGLTHSSLPSKHIAVFGCFQTSSSRVYELNFCSMKWHETLDQGCESGPSHHCVYGLLAHPPSALPSPPQLPPARPACRPLPARTGWSAPVQAPGETRAHTYTLTHLRLHAAFLFTRSLHSGAQRGHSRRPRGPGGAHTLRCLQLQHLGGLAVSLPGSRLRRPCPPAPYSAREQPRPAPPPSTRSCLLSARVPCGSAARRGATAPGAARHLPSRVPGGCSAGLGGDLTLRYALNRAERAALGAELGRGPLRARTPGTSRRRGSALPRSPATATASGPAHLGPRPHRNHRPPPTLWAPGCVPAVPRVPQAAVQPLVAPGLRELLTSSRWRTWVGRRGLTRTTESGAVSGTCLRLEGRLRVHLDLFPGLCASALPVTFYPAPASAPGKARETMRHECAAGANHQDPAHQPPRHSQMLFPAGPPHFARRTLTSRGRGASTASARAQPGPAQAPGDRGPRRSGLRASTRGSRTVSRLHHFARLRSKANGARSTDLVEGVKEPCTEQIGFPHYNAVEM